MRTKSKVRHLSLLPSEGNQPVGAACRPGIAEGCLGCQEPARLGAGLIIWLVRLVVSFADSVMPPRAQLSLFLSRLIPTAGGKGSIFAC